MASNEKTAAPAPTAAAAPELLSLRGYARRRGVALNAIQVAIKSGRIPVVEDGSGKKWIDPVAADAAWEANTDIAKQNRRPPAPAGGEGQDQPEKPGEKTARLFNRAKARKARYEAKLKSLEYKEKLGTLVSAAQVKADAFQAARITRDAILGIPDRIAGILAAEMDKKKTHAILSGELLKALENLTREGNGKGSL